MWILQRSQFIWLLTMREKYEKQQLAKPCKFARLTKIRGE